MPEMTSTEWNEIQRKAAELMMEDPNKVLGRAVLEAYLGESVRILEAKKTMDDPIKRIREHHERGVVGLGLQAELLDHIDKLKRRIKYLEDVETAARHHVELLESASGFCREAEDELRVELGMDPRWAVRGMKV